MACFYEVDQLPMGDRRVLFAAKQEAARKDVERAFGVLQSRWAIVKGPTRFWFKEVIADVMYACIILHNKIVEHSGGSGTDWGDDKGGSSSSTTTPPVARGSRETDLNAQPTRPCGAHERHD